MATKKTTATLTQIDTQYVIYNSTENKILLMSSLSMVEEYLDDLSADEVGDHLVFKTSDIYKPSRATLLDKLTPADSEKYFDVVNTL